MLPSSSVTTAGPALLLLQRQQQLRRLWCALHQAAALHFI
jgi:hypothetical protein